MATITPQYTSIDSLSITLIGNASAQLNIHFNAKLITLESFKDVARLQHSWSIIIIQIIGFLTTYLLSYLNGSPVPQMGNSKSLELPSKLISAIFNIQTTTVSIEGNIDMTNNSTTPITAKVFAESITVNHNGKLQKIINADKLFLGYVDHQNSDKRKASVKHIIPIKGAVIKTSNTPT